MAKTGQKSRTPQIHVVFDTNALFTEAADKLLNQELTAFIAEEAKSLGVDVRWYVPTSVEDERRNQMLERGKGLLLPLGKLEALLGHKLGMTAETLALRVDEAIARQITALNLNRLSLDYGKVDWQNLATLAVRKQPPFSPGSEKGFKDALVLEAFAQLAENSPRSPANCRIVLLTGDELLQSATRQRIAHFQNVTVVPDLGALKTLLNAVASHLSQEAVEELIPKAASLFYNFESRDGHYVKWDLRSSALAKFPAISDETPSGFAGTIIKTVRIYQPSFLEKTGQRVRFSSVLGFEVEAWRISRAKDEDTNATTFSMTPELKNPSQPTSGGIWPILSMTNPSLLTSKMNKVTRQGDHRVEVVWDATLTARGALTNPLLQELRYKSISWSSDDVTTEVA